MSRLRENYREDVAGRANVEDTPKLLAYYEELEKLEAGALWTVANKIEPWEPKSDSVPVLWRYRDMRELVLRSVSMVTPEKAGRRVVYLNNPGRREYSAAVGWLFSGLQVMHPGERASAHAHSASALRFIMEGAGAYTIVNGRKLTLGANDFVITPNGCWHEHGVVEDGKPCIWQDGLDIPLTNALETNFYAVHKDLTQVVTHPVNHSVAAWGNAGLRPYGEEWNNPYSPLLKFEWGPTYEALVKYSKVTDGSPYDGILMNYVNPLTGGPVMQTTGAAMQLLRPGEHTRAHRHTGCAVYQVSKGKGYSIINGKRFDWQERDIFCVPAWAWHEHGNASNSEDACLFNFNDSPTINALGLYREQAFGQNDGHQPILT